MVLIKTKKRNVCCFVTIILLLRITIYKPIKHTHMLYNVSNYSEQEVQSTVANTEIKLSENSSSMIFKLFSKNIYSNAIGSIVREVTSNCFDSHIEAKVDTPVLLKKWFDGETETHYISFIDYGVGMSPDRIKNIFAVFFESSKRADAEQIGGFGLGSKTPLAYKRSTGLGEGEYDNSYNVITNYDGIKYTYLIFEGESSPMIALLYQEETTEHNGTEIRIPVLYKDLGKFETEVIRQLYYFKNIIFEGFNSSSIVNDYQIIQCENFFYRGTECHSAMHVCLGSVAYPIDYNALELSSGDYAIPLALRFEIGELNVTVSREQLDYNETTIKLLKAKLEAAKEEVRQMLIKQYENVQTLTQYLAVKKNFSQLFFTPEISVYAKGLIDIKKISFLNYKYDGVDIKDENQMFRFFVDATMYGKPISKKAIRNGRTVNGQFKFTIEEIKKNDNLYHVDGEFERNTKKQGYIKSLHERFYVLKKSDMDAKLIKDDDAGLELKLGDIEDNAILLEEMQEEFFTLIQDNTPNYDNLIIPAEYLERKKRSVISEEIKKSTISISLMYGSNRNIYKNRVRAKMSDLMNLKVPIVYGTVDDYSQMEACVTFFEAMFNVPIISEYTDKSYYASNPFKMMEGPLDKKQRSTGYQGFAFVLLSQANLKLVKYLYNPLTIEEFKSKYGKRKLKVYEEFMKVKEVHSAYSSLDALYKAKEFNTLSTTWGAKIIAAKDFITKHRLSEKDAYYTNTRFIEWCTGYQKQPLPASYQAAIDNINEIHELQQRNRKTLNYISIPYYLSDVNPELWDILLAVMDLN